MIARIDMFFVDLSLPLSGAQCQAFFKYVYFVNVLTVAFSADIKPALCFGRGLNYSGFLISSISFVCFSTSLFDDGGAVSPAISSLTRFISLSVVIKNLAKSRRDFICLTLLFSKITADKARASFRSSAACFASSKVRKPRCEDTKRRLPSGRLLQSTANTLR